MLTWGSLIGLLSADPDFIRVSDVVEYLTLRVLSRSRCVETRGVKGSLLESVVDVLSIRTNISKLT